ncbi:MAG: glycosyltransferase [Planctomycetota bacterium]
MRILFVTPFLPHPEASHGGGSYVGALASAMGKRDELGLVHLSGESDGDRPGDGSGGARGALWSWQAGAAYQGDGTRRRCGGPTSRRSAAAHRARMLWRWRRKPLLAAKYWQPTMAGLLARARREFEPDVALLEMPQMAQYLPLLAELPTILTDHEAGRPANAATGLGRAADRRDERLWRSYIQRHYRQASAVQAVTEEDAADLTQQLGLPVTVRPPTLQLPTRAAAPASAPSRALFLGDYRHAPNREAAHRLVEQVWPLVRRQCPTAELWLAGPHDAAIRSLAAADQGIHVRGFVADLDALMGSVRLLLAPLWSGRGFRVKNATALAYGLPIVTNALGARGCRAPAASCAVHESPQELARAATAWLLDAELAGRGGADARKWAQKRYDAEAVAQLQRARIEALLQRTT